jgi:MscS family membrane protein
MRLGSNGKAIALLVAGLCAAAYAQTPAALGAGVTPKTSSETGQRDPLKRDSPRSSVFAFLEACHSKNYGEAWRYLDLRKLPEGKRWQEGPELAQQLGQILDRDGQFDVAALSAAPEGDLSDKLPPNIEDAASFTVKGKAITLQLERVRLHSGLSVWLFSAASVAEIPELARMTSASPIEKYLPEPLVDWKLLDTPLWRWVALALLAIALTALTKLLGRAAVRLLELMLKRLVPQMNRRVLEEFVGPLRLLLWVAVFRAGIGVVGPAPLLRLYLERGLALLFVLGVAWLSMGVVDVAIRRINVGLRAKHPAFSYSVLPLIARIAKLLVLVFALTALLGDWGYNTTNILAGVGIGGLAIALAAQKSLENLFGGVAVISDRPVHVGDFCRFGDRVGTVEDIGLRSTRIRTLDRTLVTVPNGQFSTMMLENFAKRDKMLFHFTLNLRRDTTPDQVRKVLASVSQILTENPKLETGKLPVRFIGVGTYSLDLEVFAYILTENGDEFLQIQQELYLAILDAVEAAGTALALPTQASIYYGPPGGSNGQNGGKRQEPQQVRR